MYATFQSLPEGTPSLVIPSLEKQDIAQMKRDLPKYDAAGVCSADAILCWEKLLKEFPTKYGGLPEREPPWIVDTLQPSARARDSYGSVVQAVTQLPERVSQKVQAAHKRR